MRSVLPVEPGSLISRPWGGRRLVAWKGIPEPEDTEPYGEAFEVSSDRRDPESSAHPSVVRLADGRRVELPALLDQEGEAILGPRLFRQHGPNLPLLPKTLDVRELLSVQAHPPGRPEAYVVLEAEPGATMRVGFREDGDAEALRTLFRTGRQAQEEGREAELELIRAAALGLLTEVPAVPGQVIFNATPDGRNAEVHALGNPEKRGILLLEVRRPGPTFRAWDHGRYPPRRIEPERAIEALSLRARDADSFVAERVEIRPGVHRTVSCAAFEVEHLEPTKEAPIDVVADDTIQTLHVVQGRARIETGDGSTSITLARGRSAVVPAVLGAWRAVAEVEPCEIVKVRVPA